MDMRVLITGGAGFIGAHSARALLAAGHEVHVVDDLSHGKREAVPAGAALEVLDVRAPQLQQSMARIRPDAVLHLAAQMDVRKSVADPTWDASVNVLGTVNVLEAALRSGVRRFVLGSSGGAVYGEQETFPVSESHPRRPASPYGVSKLCAEEYVAHYTRAHGLSALSLRYANVYGPGQDPLGEAGVVAIFLGKLVRGEVPVINGDGLQTRDYVHVADVARANLLALESQHAGALNIGTGRECDVVTLARLLAEAAGAPSQVRHGPPAPGEQRRSVVDPAAAGTALGWTPRIALEEGVRDTAQFFRAGARR
jgi:UDP-glucose 4-epimerase